MTSKLHPPHRQSGADRNTFQIPFASTPQLWVLVSVRMRPDPSPGLASTRLAPARTLAESMNGRARVGMPVGEDVMSVMFDFCSSRNPDASNPNRRLQSPKNPVVIRPPL